MDPKGIIAILIIVAAVIIIIAAIIAVRRRHTSARLKQHFGSEYDRAVREQGTAAGAEANLAAREERVHKLSLRELPASERAEYANEWTAVQARFVDDPSIAVNEADRLVERVMAARGYPMADFDHRAEAISVNYPSLVENYRSARDITVRHGGGQATTEDLRQAMVYYRSLFDELLGTTDHTVLKRAS